MIRTLLPLLLALPGCTVMQKDLWRVEVRGDLTAPDGTVSPFFGRGYDEYYDDLESEVEVPDWRNGDNPDWNLVFFLADHRSVLPLAEGSSGISEGSGGALGLYSLREEDLTGVNVVGYAFDVEHASSGKMVFEVDVLFDQDYRLQGSVKMKGFADAREPDDTGTFYDAL